MSNSKWWNGTLKSVAVGFGVFTLGCVFAVWMTGHNVHGWLEFLDDLVAGVSAGLLVLVYERSRQRTIERLHGLNRALENQAAVLKSREELLKVFVKNVPAGVAMFDNAMHYAAVSDRWCADYGVDSSQVVGRSHYDVFPDVPKRWKEMHARGLAGETLRADEDSWERVGGSTTWVRWEIRPWRTANEEVGGILIFAEDITLRKQLEEALSSTSRKLIEAQEQERKRIGRELHDDINQRLAILAVQLQQLENDPCDVTDRLRGLRGQVIEISTGVQAISHELHSSNVEYLGVVAGIKSWCREITEHGNMEIEFKSDVSNAVPYNIGISLFRVLQEALHNAVKHSGVKRIEVQLWENSGEIQLIVRDSGKGFDVETGVHGNGLGLTSMRERVRMINGTIAIDSKPLGGTTIRVKLPLISKSGSARGGAG